jgi:hypothetical protein
MRVPGLVTPTRPLEQTLFANRSLNVDRAETIVNDPAQFGSVLQKLRDEYYADPDATALADAYRAQIAGTLAASAAGIELADMACGLSVCAAEFTSDSKLAPMEFLEPVMNSGHDGGAKLYSAVMGFGAPSKADPHQRYRLIFATDPSANRMRASPMR